MVKTNLTLTRRLRLSFKLQRRKSQVSKRREYLFWGGALPSCQKSLQVWKETAQDIEESSKGQINLDRDSEQDE